MRFVDAAGLRRFWIGVVVAAAFAGAAAADRFAPASPALPAPQKAGAPGAVWACPMVKGAGTSGWIHVANAGTTPSLVRVTFIPDGAPPVVIAVTVEPGRATTVGAPANMRQAAGALVEAGGGELIVSRSAFLVEAPGRSGAAAAACRRPDEQTVVVPVGSTLGAETQIVMLNPGASDAVVDVALAFDGERQEPETLRGRVVPARGRLVIRAGDFAFDVSALTAIVTARSGRVVAEGLLVRGGSIELVPGGAAAQSLVALTSSGRGPGGFATVAIGDADAVIEARLLTTTGQSSFEALAAGVPPYRPIVAGVPPAAGPAGPAALAVESATSGLAIVGSWQVSARGASDQLIAPGTVPSRRAVAVMGVPATPGSTGVLLAATDEEAAVVDITVLTEAGPVAPPQLKGLRVEAGRTAVFGLPGVPATSAFGVVISSSAGAFVAALDVTSVLSGFFGAYAVAAVPTIASPPVGVVMDPRTGIPAA